jgi:hypothetical protein
LQRELQLKIEHEQKEREEKERIQREIKLNNEIERNKQIEESKLLRKKECLQNWTRFKFETKHGIFSIPKDFLEKFPNSVFNKRMKIFCNEMFGEGVIYIPLENNSKHENLIEEKVDGQTIYTHINRKEIESIFKTNKIKFRFLKTFTIFLDKDFECVVHSDVSPSDVLLYKFIKKKCLKPENGQNHWETIFNHIGITFFESRIFKVRKYIILQTREIEDFEAIFQIKYDYDREEEDYRTLDEFGYSFDFPYSIMLFAKEKHSISKLWKIINSKHASTKLIEKKSIWFPKNCFRIDDMELILFDKSSHCLQSGLTLSLIMFLLESNKSTSKIVFLRKKFGYIPDSDTFPLKCSDYFSSQQIINHVLEESFYKKLNRNSQEYYEVPQRFKYVEWIKYIQSNTKIQLEFSDHATWKYKK